MLKYYCKNCCSVRFDCYITVIYYSTTNFGHKLLTFISAVKAGLSPVTSIFFSKPDKVGPAGRKKADLPKESD